MELLVGRERNRLKLEIDRMIIEINYTALHWDNHQGGSGNPISGRLLRDVSNDLKLCEVRAFANAEIERKSRKTKTLIGDYIISNIIIDA